jgi:hypothetical protein
MISNCIPYLFGDSGLLDSFFTHYPSSASAEAAADSGRFCQIVIGYHRAPSREGTKSTSINKKGRCLQRPFFYIRSSGALVESVEQ